MQHTIQLNGTTPYLPWVTIVIAVFNAGGTIRKCLDSCLLQHYPNKQIIVIDGGSTDGTVEALADYHSELLHVVSEPDNGIYHAWNKALRLINTDWVTFLGADDEWSSAISLERMMDRAHYPNVNFVCAKVYKAPYMEVSGSHFGECWNYSRMKWKMNIAHTGMLHHISLFEKYGYFNETYKIAGDYEFLLRVGKDVRADYLDDVVVLMGGGGVSSRNLSVVHKEGRRALIESSKFGHVYGWLFYYMFYLKYFRRLLYARRDDAGKLDSPLSASFAQLKSWKSRSTEE